MTSDVSRSFAEPSPPHDPAAVDELERRFGEGTRRKTPHAAADGKGATTNVAPDRVELRLYVSADSLNSSRAVLALGHIVRAFPSRMMRTTILDVATAVEAAEQDRVLFTPTLILIDRQRRSTRVLGDLSKVDVLVELLRATGLEPV